MRIGDKNFVINKLNVNKLSQYNSGLICTEGEPDTKVKEKTDRVVHIDKM